jgi:hypothetical protein
MQFDAYNTTASNWKEKKEVLRKEIAKNKERTVASGGVIFV